MKKKIPRILVTSISNKIPLLRELDKSLKKISIESAIIGADSNPKCIGSYFVDEFWHMPLLSDLSEKSFISKVLELNITGIIATRDDELCFFARQIEALKEHDIHLMLPTEETVKSCLDKLKFSEVLEKYNYPVIPSTINIDELNTDNFVVKEQFGAGAHSILLNANKHDALVHSTKLKNPLFQPFIEGDEFSIDVYFSENSIFMGAVVRKREVVINGESQVTVTINDPVLAKLCENIGVAINLKGHAVLQVIKDQQNNFHIIEINTRFGGASTLSITAGLDTFYWFSLESINTNIEDYSMIKSPVQLRQVRYPMDRIIEV